MKRPRPWNILIPYTLLIAILEFGAHFSEVTLNGQVQGTLTLVLKLDLDVPAYQKQESREAYGRADKVL